VIVSVRLITVLMTSTISWCSSSWLALTAATSISSSLGGVVVVGVVAVVSGFSIAISVSSCCSFFSTTGESVCSVCFSESVLPRRLPPFLFFFLPFLLLLTVVGFVGSSSFSSCCWMSRTVVCKSTTFSFVVSISTAGVGDEISSFSAFSSFSSSSVFVVVKAISCSFWTGISISASGVGDAGLSFVAVSVFDVVVSR